MDLFDLKDRARLLGLTNTYIDDYYIDEDYNISIELFRYLKNRAGSVIKLPEGIDCIHVKERFNTNANIKVVFPSTVERISSSVFHDIGIIDFWRPSIYINSPNMILDFRKCKKMVRIGYSCFSLCHFKGLYFGYIKEIEYRAFENCILNHLKIEVDENTDINKNVFNGVVIKDIRGLPVRILTQL